MTLPLPDPQVASPGRSPKESFEAIQRNFDALATQVATTAEVVTGIDAHKAMAFTAAAVVTLDHNLGKRPAVSVVDSAGSEWVIEVEHLSANTCQITFDHPFSGTAYFN